jgi:hypothetical protein
MRLFTLAALLALTLVGDAAACHRGRLVGRFRERRASRFEAVAVQSSCGPSAAGYAVQSNYSATVQSSTTVAPAQRLMPMPVPQSPEKVPAPTVP